MGYRGNVAALWRYLDRDGSRHITIQEVDASSAVLLAEFKLLVNDMFGGSIPKMIEALDANRSNKIFKDEFTGVMRNLGYRGPVKRLFDILSRQQLGFLAPQDMTFLERWEPP